jgi:hypothetical protein
MIISRPAVARRDIIMSVRKPLFYLWLAEMQALTWDHGGYLLVCVLDPLRHVGQAFRPHRVIDGVLAVQRGIAFEIFAHLGGTVMDFVGGTIDVFGSLPDIIVDSRKLGLAHPVGPHDPTLAIRRAFG